MKNIRTLSTVANAVVSWSNGVTASHEARKNLLTQCNKLALPEKQRVDLELVNYYAVQAGVGVKTREKAHALFCASVPAWEKNDKGQVSHPAAMALSRARGILFAAEKGEKTPAKAGATTPAKAAKPATVAQILSFAEAALERKANGEKFAADEKKSIRRAAQMLLALL